MQVRLACSKASLSKNAVPHARTHGSVPLESDRAPVNIRVHTRGTVCTLATFKKRVCAHHFRGNLRRREGAGASEYARGNTGGLRWHVRH